MIALNNFNPTSENTSSTQNQVKGFQNWPLNNNNNTNNNRMNMSTSFGMSFNNKRMIGKQQFDLSQIAEDPMDNYLDTLGLWKKRIARDGSCLFRAVAEQVFKKKQTN
jgi:hypothetical protein